MGSIEIKRITAEDVYRLQQIGKQTFSETFSAGNSEENMRKYLEEGFSIEKLKSELENTSSEFYFAELDTEVVDYLKLNFGKSQTELKDDKALEIERIYVLKKLHGKNVGQLLYENAKEIAVQKNAEYIWLACGKKIRGRSIFTGSRASWSLTNIFSGWEMMSKQTS